MGKKRSVQKEGGGSNAGQKNRALSRLPKKKLSHGIVYIESTHNNTRVSLTETTGGVVMWAASGLLGFKGTKKSTPFAASQVADLIAEKANAIGVSVLEIVVKGVGPGRESALRSFSSGKHRFELKKISDRTPVPHNGPRPRKAKRV